MMAKGRPNKRSTAQFKRHMVETMRAEGMSDREAMRQIELGGHHIIRRWERIYPEAGIEGLDVARRGRAAGSKPLGLLN